MVNKIIFKSNNYFTYISIDRVILGALKAIIGNIQNAFRKVKATTKRESGN